MLRLSTENGQSFNTADRFQVNIGGSEMNVAMSLASSGIDTSLITALPENPFSHRTISLLKCNNVDTSNIKTIGNRMGDYCHQILPPLPSFLTPNDKECTTDCQQTYQYI